MIYFEVEEWHLLTAWSKEEISPWGFLISSKRSCTVSSQMGHLMDYVCWNFCILSVKYNSKEIMRGEMKCSKKQSITWNTMSSSVSNPLMKLQICINILPYSWYGNPWYVHGMKNSVKKIINQIFPAAIQC